MSRCPWIPGKILAYTVAVYMARLDEWVLYFVLYGYYFYQFNYGG